MTRFYHSKGLGTEVLDYRTEGGQDWLLTLRVPGEDCTHADFVSSPERLCDLTATLLRELHSVDTAGCPIPDHTARYLALAERNYRTDNYDSSLFPDNWGYASADEAWQVIETEGHRLKTDTLLHLTSLDSRCQGVTKVGVVDARLRVSTEVNNIITLC